MAERSLATLPPRYDATPVAKATDPAVADLMLKVVVGGDLSKLGDAERLAYYQLFCDAAGVDWRTRPFDFIVLDNKLTLYANATATDQLARRHAASVEIVSRQLLTEGPTAGIYTVTARATTPDGRVTEAIAAVPLFKENGTWKPSGNGKNYFEPDGTTTPLRPTDVANALMKTETKARRRAIKAHCGFGGIPDESEVETIASARYVDVDFESGAIRERAQAPIAETPATQLPQKSPRRIAADAVFAWVGEAMRRGQPEGYKPDSHAGTKALQAYVYEEDPRLRGASFRDAGVWTEGELREFRRRLVEMHPSDVAMVLSSLDPAPETVEIDGAEVEIETGEIVAEAEQEPSPDIDPHEAAMIQWRELAESARSPEDWQSMFKEAETNLAVWGVFVQAATTVALLRQIAKAAKAAGVAMPALVGAIEMREAQLAKGQT